MPTSPPKRSPDTDPTATMRPDLLERLARANAERARQALLRRVRNVECIDGRHLVIDRRRLLDFASNDYLGLAAHPAVCEALKKSAANWGVGATAAHLLGGHRDEHERLEHKLAEWTGRERALLFSTGYMANLGVLGALLGDGDICVQDRFNHASLIDGARLSGAELKRYPHNDVEGATRQLRARADKPALLVSEGVFSMDGDRAPLRELNDLCRDEAVTLMIDDAHGIGVFGKRGAGSVSESKLNQRDVPILMATLGKAVGVGGAFVAGGAALIDGLIQNARSYIYTTAMPTPLAAAISSSIELIRGDDGMRARLHANIARFREGALERGIHLLPSDSPIQPVMLGTSERALAVSQHLFDAGFHVPAIRPPTVPAGRARLRVTLSAAHTWPDIDRLIAALVNVAAREPAMV